MKNQEETGKVIIVNIWKNQEVMPKAALHNLGCKVNAYETEAMEQQLKERGYEIVPFDEKADVYIINTCSVTNIADRKSRQMLHRAKKLNPESVVVAAGCYVQVASEELKKDASVDIVIGNNKKAELADILDEYLGNVHEEEEAEVFVTDLSHGSDYEALHLEQPSDHTRAFIKVQDGCNQFCSYCIIPYARGRVRSRSREDVVKEITGLVAQGYKEAVLTGIHLSSYGIEHMEGNPVSQGDWNHRELLALIREVHEIEGLERIRLGSLEPRIITEEFAKSLAELPKFCPHFHLSLQSGCDSVLKRMNRHYTTEDYLRRCEILRKYFKRPVEKPMAPPKSGSAAPVMESNPIALVIIMITGVNPINTVTDCVVAMAAKTRSRSGMKIASLLPNFATTFAIST